VGPAHAKASRLPYHRQHISATRANACEAVSEVIAAGMLPGGDEMLDGRMVQVNRGRLSLRLSGATPSAVLTEIDGIEALMDAKCTEVARDQPPDNAMSVDMSADPAARAKLWKARKSAFGAIGRISHSYCTQDACVPRSMLASVLKRINEIGRPSGWTSITYSRRRWQMFHPIFFTTNATKPRCKHPGRRRAGAEILHRRRPARSPASMGSASRNCNLMPYLFDEHTMMQFHRGQDSVRPGRAQSMRGN